MIKFTLDDRYQKNEYTFSIIVFEPVAEPDDDSDLAILMEQDD
jgi:hypothetical protein